jgi:hypothetical protein
MILCFSWSFIPFLPFYLSGLIRVCLGFQHFPPLFEILICFSHDSLDINLGGLLFLVDLVPLVQFGLHEMMALKLVLRRTLGDTGVSQYLVARLGHYVISGMKLWHLFSFASAWGVLI